MVKKATSTTKSATKAPAKSSTAKKAKADAASFNPKGAVYAVLGIQKAAYDFGVEKYNALNDLRKEKLDMSGFIKRGEEVESMIQGKYEEFKGSDSFVAKRVVDAEQRYKSVAEKVSVLNEKVTSSVKKIQDKVQSAVA